MVGGGGGGGGGGGEGEGRGRVNSHAIALRIRQIHLKPCMCGLQVIHSSLAVCVVCECGPRLIEQGMQ